LGFSYIIIASITNREGGLIRMRTLKTVDQAKRKIETLQMFVDLVEGYRPETIEQKVLKEYAYLGNIVKVAEKVNSMGYSIDERPYEGTDISNIIKGKGNDELHKYIRKGYLIKTRPSRRRS
jgi:hypothetical protein